MGQPKPTRRLLPGKLPAKPWQAAAVVGLCVLVGYVIIQVFAAGPGSGFLVSGATLSGKATVVVNSSALGGHMVVFGATPAPTPTPTPAPTATPAPTPTATPAPGSCTTYTTATTEADCGYPTASTTGPTGCASYTNAGATTITTAGTTLNCYNITGILDIEASNVTISNTIVTGNAASWWGIKYGASTAAATNLKVLHDTIKAPQGSGPDNGGYDYGVSQQGTGTMEVGYSDISGFKDGIDASSANVHDNYVHALSQFTGAHTQAVYGWCGGSGVTLSHNTLLNQTGQQYASAALYIAPDCGHQNNWLVDNNWLAGGSLVLYGGDSTATNMRVTNNKFSTEIWSPGGGFNGTAGYWQPGNTGNVWSGNLWANGPNHGATVAHP